MITRNLKSAFYAMAGPLMKLNGTIYKIFRAPKGNHSHKILVQLGPGQNNYLQGWINVDANVFTGKADLWADLRNELPFNNNSVDFFYSHHVIEHLPDIKHHLRSMFRCLKPGAAIRIGGPNGDSAINRFVAGDLNWFGDFPDSRKSIGGRFENFIFCRQEHLTILTFSYLEELLIETGFVNIQRKLPVRETSFPEIVGDQILSMEYEGDFINPHTLIIEAQKPFN